MVNSAAYSGFFVFRTQLRLQLLWYLPYYSNSSWLRKWSRTFSCDLEQNLAM